MDRSMIPSTEEDFDRILRSISHANITEALSPRPGSISLQTQQSSPYSAYDLAQASPSIQLSPSSPPAAASACGGGLPSPLILTSEFIPAPGGNKRVDSTDLWAAAGEAGTSTHGVGAYDHRSPGRPSSDSGSLAGSGYYTPSYASSYDGSLQDDSSSFLGDAFDGKLDFLELGDASYDPDGEAGREGGLAPDVARMLEAWGQEQGLMMQQHSQASEPTPPGPGSTASGSDADPSSGRASQSSLYTAPLDDDAQQRPRHKLPTRTETTDSNMTVSLDTAPALARAAAARPSGSQHPFVSPGYGPISPSLTTGSLSSASQSTSHRSPPTISIPDDARQSSDPPLSASSLFPPLDPRMPGLYNRQGMGLAPRPDGLGGPMIEISPATPISGQRQGPVFSETLAALGERRGDQAIPDGGETAQPQKASDGSKFESTGPVPDRRPFESASGTASASSSSLHAASSDVGSSNGFYSPHQSLPDLSDRPHPQRSPVPQTSTFPQATAFGFQPQSSGPYAVPPPTGHAFPPWLMAAPAMPFPTQGIPWPAFGQPGPSYYMQPGVMEYYLQQQQQLARQPPAGPPTSAPPATSHPHLKAPPKRQRSRSDASALPYDFGPAPPAAPTMDPSMLSNYGGGSFFPGQPLQQMESPLSSPRSVSSALPTASQAFPAFNPLPPPSNTMLFNPTFPSYSSLGSGGASSAAGDLHGPQRTSHVSASFGAGTPGYGAGLLYPWGVGGFDPAAHSAGVQRSISDAGRGRKGHRKVQSVDMSYTRPDGTLGVPLASVRSPRRSSAGGGSSSSSRSPARSPTPELRALSPTPDDGDAEMAAGSGGSSVGSVTRQSVTTKKTAAASQGRRKTAANFVCPLPGCGSSFTRSFNLKGHLRSHTDERPFKCSTCGKGFARAHDCKRHMALHVGYRPHVCLGCDKRFARLDALSRHLRSDAGQECVRGGKMAAPAEGGPGGDDDGEGSCDEGSDDDENAAASGSGNRGVLL